MEDQVAKAKARKKPVKDAVILSGVAVWAH